MKKILTTLAVGAMLASAASADVARLEMGVGAWQQTASGDITYVDSLATGSDDYAKSDEQTSGYAWMLIKHPIPILPNIRLEYASLEGNGEANGTFDDFTVSAGATLFEMTQYDIIPYYNILDNTGWVTLDLGLDLKVIDTTWTVNDVTGWTDSVYDDSETLVIPLIYVRTRVEIPGTNIGLEADGKYITYDDSTIYDIRAKVDYTLDFIPVIQPAIEVGYRIQKFDISDDGDTAGSTAAIDLEFSGVYAGMMLRF